MNSARRYVNTQNGYTLLEVVIAAAIGAIVLAGLTSVVFTSVRAANTATSRVEASSQIRNFEFFAYDDFARSGVPSVAACTPSAPCTTQPIVLTGTRVNNSAQPVTGYTVNYTWDGSNFLDREVAGTGATIHAATNVSAFSWYLDTSAAFPTVVVSLTVTVQAYSESQTFLFYPRLNP